MITEFDLLMAVQKVLFPSCRRGELGNGGVSVPLLLPDLFQNKGYLPPAAGNAARPSPRQPSLETASAEEGWLTQGHASCQDHAFYSQ